MSKILIIIAAVLIFILINVEVSALNPCSQFSAEPQRCSSGE